HRRDRYLAQDTSDLHQHKQQRAAQAYLYTGYARYNIPATAGVDTGVVPVVWHETSGLADQQGFAYGPRDNLRRLPPQPDRPDLRSDLADALEHILITNCGLRIADCR